MARKVKTMNSKQAWNYSLGLLKVDGLSPSKEFRKLVDLEQRGKVTDTDIKRFLDKKYKNANIF